MLHSQDRCVHNVWVTSQTLSPHSVTPPLHHGHQLLFKHTHKHKLTQIHTHTNTPHILQIFLPSNSEAALLSKVPGLQSYRGKSLSSILNIFKKNAVKQEGEWVAHSSGAEGYKGTPVIIILLLMWERKRELVVRVVKYWLVWKERTCVFIAYIRFISFVIHSYRKELSNK